MAFKESIQVGESVQIGIVNKKDKKKQSLTEEPNKKEEDKNVENKRTSG